MSAILAGREEIPEDWKKTVVKMIYKGKGKDRDDIASYRPVAITSVVYKLFTIILKERLEEWAEEEGKIGEMQNGFRKDRRGTDNLYILDQVVGVARKQKRKLGVCLLDLTAAYDNVERGKLWRLLKDEG